MHPTLTNASKLGVFSDVPNVFLFLTSFIRSFVRSLVRLFSIINLFIHFLFRAGAVNSKRFCISTSHVSCWNTCYRWAKLSWISMTSWNLSLLVMQGLFKMNYRVHSKAPLIYFLYQFLFFFFFFSVSIMKMQATEKLTLLGYDLTPIIYFIFFPFL